MLCDDLGQSKVTVNKDELLLAVMKNRNAHNKSYIEARAGYKESLIEELERMLIDVRSSPDNKNVNTHIMLEPPQDHTAEYDRIIRMLQMSQADSITITEKQFSQYVMDEWAWSHSFTSNVAIYSGKAKK